MRFHFKLFYDFLLHYSTMWNIHKLSIEHVKHHQSSFAHVPKQWISFLVLLLQLFTPFHWLYNAFKRTDELTTMRSGIYSWGVTRFQYDHISVSHLLCPSRTQGTHWTINYFPSFLTFRLSDSWLRFHWKLSSGVFKRRKSIYAIVDLTCVCGSITHEWNRKSFR